MKKSSSLRARATRTVHIGDVSIAEICVTRRAVAERVDAACDGAPLRELIFVLSGELCLRYRGQPLRLQALQWSACDAGQVLLSAAENTCALVMTVPAGDEVQSNVHSATNGLGSVLFACCQSALKVAGELTSQARDDLGDSLIELSTLALREQSAPVRRVPGRKLMRDRVKSFIRHHVRESSLSIDDIARTFNCTKRYLHKVFSDDERSLNRFIWDLRLDRCSRDLANPGLLDRSITEIAFGWGFRNTPHFSRQFRQRFGVSPSAYRAAQPRSSRRTPCAATCVAYSDTAS
jgi:AraC-like DNA-binding protein